MKKIYLLFVTFYFLLGVNAYAATSTPSPVETQINELKDKIASRVAQLKLVERRGIIGTVSDISDTQITLTDVKGDVRFVDVDELTKFLSREKSGFGISDIKKDSVLSILGLYNKQSRRILARSVAETSLSEMINGDIATIDTDNFIFNIATSKKEQLKISVEVTTKTLSFDKESQELVRSGFSKLKANQKVFIRGTKDPQDKKKILADKIIVFPDIVKATSLPISKSQQATNSAVPTSTGSGKKLTPITR